MWFFSDVTPTDPVFLVGNHLRLNCSLKRKLNGFNSSDLVFKLRFYGNSSDTIIPPKFIHQMSNRIAQLIYVELKQEHHLAKVFCGLRILKDDEYAIITVGREYMNFLTTYPWLYWLAFLQWVSYRSPAQEYHFSRFFFVVWKAIKWWISERYRSVVKTVTV